MIRKKTRGITLVELLVTISLLAIVAGCAGSAVHSALQSYVINKKLQDDQYNVRMALLSIAREAHRGVIYDDVNGATRHEYTAIVGPDDEEILINGKLILVMADGSGEIVFQIVGNKLTRTGSGADSSPINFVEVELESFNPQVSVMEIVPKDESGNVIGDTFQRCQLTIQMKGENELELDTTLSLSRIPSILISTEP